MSLRADYHEQQQRMDSGSPGPASHVLFDQPGQADLPGFEEQAQSCDRQLGLDFAAGEVNDGEWAGRYDPPRSLFNDPCLRGVDGVSAAEFEQAEHRFRRAYHRAPLKADAAVIASMVQAARGREGEGPQAGDAAGPPGETI